MAKYAHHSAALPVLCAASFAGMLGFATTAIMELK
jgi:hypothetical protein